MKKLLTVLAVIALFAVSSFAFTTYVQELSMSEYPGVLEPGSTTGLKTFVQDVTEFGNSTLLEYIDSTAFGSVSLETAMGTFMLAVSPIQDITLEDIDTYIPDGSVALLWGKNMDFGKIGVGVVYGSEYEGDEDVDSDAITTNNPDRTGDYEHYLAVKTGLGLKGLDLALNFETLNESETSINRNNNKKIIAQSTEDYGKMKIGAAARLSLGDGMLAMAGVNYTNGSEIEIDKTDANDDGDFSDAGIDTNTISTDSNSAIGFEARFGKEIKATDSLTVKIASGITGTATTNYESVSENKNATTNPKSYIGSTWSNLTMYVPVNVAVVGKLNETWSFNAGASFTLLSFETETDKFNENPANEKPNMKAEDVETNFYMQPELAYAIGVTGKFGDLRLDMYLNPAILINGPNFISGQSAVLNNGVALVYDWK